MDIIIDGVIGNEPGEVSAAVIKSQLTRANGQPITVRIHSEGGSVFEGFAIYDALKAYAGPKKCLIESCAFSMASLVSMACDQREITPNGFLMVHNPSTDDGRDPPPVLEALRKRLVSIYAEGTRRSVQAIESWMRTETFFDATESIKYGFVNAITSPSARAVALLQATIRGHAGLRGAIVAKLKGDKTMTASERWNEACKASIATNCNDRIRAIRQVDKTHPGLRMQMIQDANTKRK